MFMAQSQKGKLQWNSDASDKYLKDTHREKNPSNKTQARTKIVNMDIWVVGTLNLVFIRGFYNEIKFS